MRTQFFLLLAAISCGPITGNDVSNEEKVEIIPPIENTAPIAPPTTLICPNGTSLNYENFGESFMLRYCTSCHSEQVVGDNRGGAPEDVNFDTPELVLIWRKSILNRAGPVEGNMPPQAGMVTRRERALLTEWLQCGAPGETDQLENKL